MAELGVDLTTKQTLSEIKLLSDKLGDWHDREVLHDSFYNYQRLMLQFEMDHGLPDLSAEMNLLKQENNRFRDKLDNYLQEFEQLLIAFR